MEQESRSDYPVEPAAVEVLHQSELTRITRYMESDGTSVIHKQPLGPGALQRARHELRILQRLADVPGVVRLAERRTGDDLLLVDLHARTLAAVGARPWIRPNGVVNVTAEVAFAAELAASLAGVHREGVVHRDLNPANILVNIELDGDNVARPVLIDFHLASTFAEAISGLSHHLDIVGTLPYAAPEQTGRTSSPVDERADLYGLGATLYELITGTPPFPLGDPLDMLRDTLTGIPVPPADRVPGSGSQLSAIVMRLLQKDPDDRYQSAEGLAHDLARLRDDMAGGSEQRFVLGERDFPRRLRAPSQLVGRDQERDLLRTTFERSVTGDARAVLIAGPPGVGKTSLVNALRSDVSGRGGWFVTGKFDQFRQDADAIVQVVRALGRLLLAGTPTEVAQARTRITAVLGLNVELFAALPEFAVLLEAAPAEPAQEGDDTTIAARRRQSAVDLLSVLASAQRPVVIVLEDLQWAGAGPVAWIHAVLTDPRLSGVLVVGTYRDGEVDATHPLAAAIERWRQLGLEPSLLTLRNLPPADLAQLLTEMLRLPAGPAQDLAAAIGDRTAGNPFDTVEVVNALRQDQTLVITDGGWAWDPVRIRRFVGAGDVLGLLTARIDRLAPPARELLELLACLGGEVDLETLVVASGSDAETLSSRLLGPLEDGLIVSELGEAPTVQFRHDRVQQAARIRLDPPARRRLHRILARRLAASPGHDILAADQYLHCVEDYEGPVELDGLHERRTAAQLMIEAGAALRIRNPAGAIRFLAEATALLGQEPEDASLRLTAHRHRHSALHTLGRFAEVDTHYADIVRFTSDPEDLVEPLRVQIASLISRGRTAEAVDLGLGMLGRFGVVAPSAAQLPAEVAEGVAGMAAWADSLDLTSDLARPELTGRSRLVALLVAAVGLPAFLSDPMLGSWLMVIGQRIGAEHGPSTVLLPTLALTITATSQFGDDFRSGYRIARHAVALGEARGQEPETSLARHVYSLMAQHWGEPLEEVISQAQRARQGLIQSGELLQACFTYGASLSALFDSSASLERCADDADTAIAFAARTGNDNATATYLVFRPLCRALQGETAGPGRFDSPPGIPERDAFDETTFPNSLASNPVARVFFHVYQAVAAALFDDLRKLTRHAAEADPLLPFVGTMYVSVLGHLANGLAAAGQLRTATGKERQDLLVALDSHRAWLAARSLDAPANYAHLATLLDAEQCWALGNLMAAARAFDSARRQVAHRSRPWHRAFITERAGRFHYEAGLPQTGQDLIREATGHYATWGATGKVNQLREEYAFLQASAAAAGPGRVGPISSSPRSRAGAQGSTLSADNLDLIAVLRTSQALSSQTDPIGLRSRIGELLGAMTGATGVFLAVLDDDTQDWRIWNTIRAGAEGVPLPLADALLPTSALRYCIRSAEPLLLSDAVTDDRFGRDPYLTALECCSLLVVPIVSKATLRTVLVLENQSRRGAFSADRLDAVQLVTSQLAISLDNAELYASLERKVAERTADLATTNLALEALSNTDALTGLPNRRFFNDRLAAAWQDALRNGTPLALAMIDVDRFKGYNDRYGHVAGDECLTRVAAALRSGLRGNSDLVFRYGGEEFAVILPGTDLAGARTIAERLRTAVVELRLTHTGSEHEVVSISVGIADRESTFGTQQPVDPQTLTAAADAQLYKAKEHGRNQVCTTATVPQIRSMVLRSR